MTLHDSRRGSEDERLYTVKEAVTIDGFTVTVVKTLGIFDFTVTVERQCGWMTVN